MESVRVPDRDAGRDDGLAIRCVPPDAGRSVLGDRVRIKLTGDDTDQAFFLFHATTPQGQGPPLHAHEREDETFYILEGRYEMQLGGERVVVGRGTCLHLPRRRAHAFVNTGSGTGAFVGLATPGGLERYFEAVSALGPSADDLVLRSAVGSPHGIHFPEDPTGLAPSEDSQVAADFTHVAPEGGTVLPSSVGAVRRLLSSDETRGALAVVEVELPPRASWAVSEQRVLYVLDGELEVEAGGGRDLIGPGTAVHVRSGARLQLAAARASGARFLLYTVPGGLEGPGSRP